MPYWFEQACERASWQLRAFRAVSVGQALAPARGVTIGHAERYYDLTTKSFVTVPVRHHL